MNYAKLSWTGVLRRHGPDYLKWLDENRILTTKFDALATALWSLLSSTIRTPEAANDVWAATPMVLSRCNEQDTYKMKGAAHAYAWLHLLDRYARTWRALEILVSEACLPLAKNGVRSLDVGTGPGPSAFAIHDFYAAMTEFGTQTGIELLKQPPSLTCVEYDHGTNRLRHYLAEIEYQQTGREFSGVLAMCHALSDFQMIAPQKERKRLYDTLLNEEDIDFDDVSNGWIGTPRHLPGEANGIAQSLHRYRLIVFSNFLTTVGTVAIFESNLVDLLTDAQPGSVVLVLGGRHGEYPDIYEYVKRLAEPAGFRLRIAGEEVSSAETEVADRIFNEGARLYEHLQSLAQNSSGEIQVVRSHFAGSRLPAPKSQVWAFRKC